MRFTIAIIISLITFDVTGANLTNSDEIKVFSSEEIALYEQVNSCVARLSKSKRKLSSPYTVKGVHYSPIKDTAGYSANGKASWYGYPFHGRKTANGDKYDMNQLTAAHKTLPLPSCVKVTNLDTGKAIVVLVNDRGPFKSDLGVDTSDRIIDLSRRGASELGLRKKGVAPVKVEAISTIIG